MYTAYPYTRYLKLTSLYTVSQKTESFFIRAKLSQTLLDFNNSFTVADRYYLPTNTLLNFPLHL